MTSPTWPPRLPWRQYSGSNGGQIAAAMTEVQGSEITIIVNPDYTGSSLSMSQQWPDGQVINDRWRVPMNYWINPENGEVRDPQGTAVDWDTLVSMG